MQGLHWAPWRTGTDKHMSTAYPTIRTVSDLVPLDGLCLPTDTWEGLCHESGLNNWDQTQMAFIFDGF